MIKESLYEFMSELQYQVWMGKAENGKLSFLAATQMFKDLLADPSNIKDELGPQGTPRIAVKVKDIFIQKNAKKRQR